MTRDCNGFGGWLEGGHGVLGFCRVYQGLCYCDDALFQALFRAGFAVIRYGGFPRREGSRSGSTMFSTSKFVRAGRKLGGAFSMLFKSTMTNVHGHGGGLVIFIHCNGVRYAIGAIMTCDIFNRVVWRAMGRHIATYRGDVTHTFGYGVILLYG